MADLNFATPQELLDYIKTDAVRAAKPAYIAGGTPVAYSGTGLDGIPNWSRALDFVEAQKALGRNYYRINETEMGKLVQAQIDAMEGRGISFTSAQYDAIWGEASTQFSRAPAVRGANVVAFVEQASANRIFALYEVQNFTQLARSIMDRSAGDGAQVLRTGVS